MTNPILITLWLIFGAVFFALSLVPNLVYLPMYADKALHANAYALFVMLPVVFLNDIRFAMAIAAALLLVGIGMEFGQTLVAGRNASIEDIFANMVGIAAGLMIGACYRMGARTAVLSAAVFCLMLPVSAHAQFLTRDEPVVSVGDRADPDFDAIGGQLGAFKIDAGAAIEQKFDDNIFRTQSNTESDKVTVFTPALTVGPDLPIHDIKLTAGAKIAQYWNNPDENYEDFGVQVSGRYDFDYNTNMRFLTGYAALHEDRSAPDASIGDTPTEYSVLRNEIGAARELGTLKIRVAAQDQRIEFDDNSFNGATVDNGARDRNVQTVTARIGYALSPATEIFTTPTYTWTNYERAGVTDRSSRGYDVTMGASHDITGKLHTDIYAGYFAREMDNNNFGDIDGAKFGGSLLWNPTELTSIKGDLGRQLRETSQSDSSGYIQTNASLGIEHALTRRTLLDASLGWANFDFQGALSGFNREDNVKQSKIGAQYKLFNGAALRADYTTTDRSSNEDGSEYENSVVNIGLGYAY